MSVEDALELLPVLLGDVEGQAAGLSRAGVGAVLKAFLVVLHLGPALGDALPTLAPAKPLAQVPEAHVFEEEEL